MKFFARRLLHSIGMLAGVSLLTFLFLALAPGNYFDEMRLNPQISPATISALRAKYALDAPLPARYASWLRSLAHGEFGYSFSYNAPVAPLLWTRALNTLLLTVTATILAWGIAVPLGVFSAARAGSATDKGTTAATSVLVATPDILLALALLYLAARTGWFPVGGMESASARGASAFARILDIAHHAALPVLALTLATLPALLRHVRSAMLGVLGSAFIRTVRASGIPKRRMLFRYALPAAANPLLSLFGFSIGALLSASLLIEVVWSWPGLGPLLLEAILSRDLFIVIGAVMMSTVFLALGNLAADVLLYAMDPRIRAEE